MPRKPAAKSGTSASAKDLDRIIAINKRIKRSEVVKVLEHYEIPFIEQSDDSFLITCLTCRNALNIQLASDGRKWVCKSLCHLSYSAGVAGVVQMFLSNQKQKEPMPLSSIVQTIENLMPPVVRLSQSERRKIKKQREELYGIFTINDN